MSKRIETPVAPSRAWVRRLSPGYAEYYAAKGEKINQKLAEQQHARYVAALRAAGLKVTVVDADAKFPDCVFIEDTCVLWGGRALVSRMTEHREGEQRGVIEILQKTHKIVRLPRGARLDGGDVMHGWDQLYVGRSSRTNEEGFAALKRLITRVPKSQLPRPVLPMSVLNCLHIKSGMSYLGDGYYLWARGLVDGVIRTARNILETAPGEGYAANTLRIGNHLLISDGFPKTEKKLREFADNHDVEVISLDMSEFRKGGGALTCLSLIG